MEESNKPKDLQKLIPPRISNFDNFYNYANYILNSREACAQRGYHRVSSEPGTDDETMICYDCDLWFSRAFAKDCEIEYKVDGFSDS